jgi:hypothetical protein
MNQPEISGSEYWKILINALRAPPPHVLTLS